LHVPPEIIEHTNEVVVKIGGHKLAQLPRSVLGFGNDLRVRGLPLIDECVDLSLAVEIFRVGTTLRQGSWRLPRLTPVNAYGGFR